MSVNIIFLDIDGVLNSKNYFIERHPKVLKLYKNNKSPDTISLKLKRMMLDIDLNKLNILKEIIKATGAYVVVTSSWKRSEIFPYVKEQLISMGIPIIGTTTDNSSNRGEGIKKYLKENSVKRYIILDDDIFEDYDEELLQHLVKTSFVNDGLTDNHKKKAIEKFILGGRMDTKKVFEETGKLGNEINRLRKQLEKVNKQCLEMMEICPHEIVFKYVDNYPRMLMIDGTYFCPACGKTIKCVHPEQIKDSSFKDSRVIPLTNLSLYGTSEVYHTIRNEVYQNMELYYNLEIDIEELSNRMEELLKDKEQRYQNSAKTLRKRK